MWLLLLTYIGQNKIMKPSSGKKVILSRLFKGLRITLFSFPLPTSEAHTIDAWPIISETKRQETAGDNLRQNHQKQVITDFLFHLSSSLSCPNTSAECCKADGIHLLLWGMQWCSSFITAMKWNPANWKHRKRGWNWELHCIWIKCDLWPSLLKKIGKEWADEKSICQLLHFNENITEKL